MEDKDLQILIKAAHAGGEVLRKYFGQALDVIEKSTLADFQTEADLESEKVILEILKKEFPNYNIQSEEEGKTDMGSEYTFVIDPMDGTNNFLLGIPNFTVSIALLHENKSVAGVVYQPISDQTYVAKRGEGAYLNDNKIKVNNFTDLEKINYAYSCAYRTEYSYLGKVLNALGGIKHKRLMFTWAGAYDLCMLASGKIESVIVDGIELHDYAAGKLIAIEAGANIIDFSGNIEKDFTNDKFIISNTAEINNYILNIIKPLQKNR